MYGFSNREAKSRDVAPVITVQPHHAILSPDLPVTFGVAAAGVPAPAFQWRFKGAAIADATSPTYAITAVSTALAGAYDVIVANRAGSITSVVAQLPWVCPWSIQASRRTPSRFGRVTSAATSRSPAGMRWAATASIRLPMAAVPLPITAPFPTASRLPCCRRTGR